MYLLNAEGEVEFTSRHKEDVLRWQWHYCDGPMIPLTMKIFDVGGLGPLIRTSPKTKKYSFLFKM